MHPVLFEFSLPSFLPEFLPSYIVLHSYGVFIALGALMGHFYLKYEMRHKFSLSSDSSSNLTSLIILGAILGGKLFLYLEDPSYYLSDPSRLIANFRQGFVFYGSFVVAVPLVLWFFKRHKISLLPGLDVIAILACILHFFGRLGCLCAGCCHGKPFDGFFSLTFTDPLTAAPMGVSLYPTQLMSMGLIFIVGAFLLFLRKRQSFHGQLFFVYVFLYGLGRSVLEEFRGDTERGFVFDNFLSHSQFLAFILVSLAIFFYFKARKSNFMRTN